MVYISNEDLDTFDHLYRINLINSCSGYKSANLLGTKSKGGVENVAVFSSVTHMGSNPAMLGFFCRPTTVTRNTYDNIKNTGFYTINHIDESILEDAHHTSAKYDSHISEFDKTQLISEYKNDFFAPFVKSAPLKMAMQFVEQYHIKANDTILVIGKIVGIYIEDELLEDDGFVNLVKGNVATINGLDGYAIPKSNTRFEYQRPK
ncbi:flavin reductase family protein [Psychroserpens sp. Hel_I_66]|uniref:flavin reductase family protein n=1 Tax=Psychroserpens sp. Hel_I_66 TaxID=1250004 RepID=UPI000646EF6A|nr:flavin reductase [Psychroserpens sp. Hel_I_66]